MRDDSVMTPKQRVALELLDSALQMYYAKSFFAAIHLAGAAEELFGAYLELWNSAKPAAESFHDDAVQALGYAADEVPAPLSKLMYRAIFHSRNRTKHMHLRDDHDISFDPLQEAEAVLGRALSNFYEVAEMLGVTPTRRMYRFNRERFSD
jgi:hypothetical protein